MITIRKSEDRGHIRHDWLDTYHTFSFSEYYDPNHMGFSVLRVINDDTIIPAAGFPMHGHQDMEIITYILKGGLEHKDSMGNTSVIYPGEVQYMCAGTGVRHSEYNHYQDQSTHLLQIWIIPDKDGYQPSYGQKSFESALDNSEWVLAVSNDGRDGSIPIHQKVDLYILKTKTQGEKKYSIHNNRNVWVQLISGRVNINGQQLNPGDGAAIAQTKELQLNWEPNTELLLFDLP